jgi:PAS domain-containing protein
MRTLIEEVPCGIFLFLSDGTILNANRASLEILGLSRFIDIAQINLFDILCSHELMDRLIRDGKKANISLTCNFDQLKKATLCQTNKSGISYFQIVFTPINNKRWNGPPEFLFLFYDITAKKRAETKFPERFQGITSNIPGIVYQFYFRDNGDSGMYFVDERSEELLGIPPYPYETWVERYSSCIVSSDRIRWCESRNKVIHQRIPWEFEGKFITSHMEEMYIRIASRPSILNGETVWNGIILNITEQKKIEEALNTSIRREICYRSIFENICNGILICEPINDGSEYILKEVNDATVRVLKKKKEDIIGKKLFEEFPDLLSPVIRDQLMRILTTGKPEFVTSLKYRTCDYFPWISYYFFKLPTGEIASFIVDVSDEE